MYRGYFEEHRIENVFEKKKQKQQTNQVYPSSRLVVQIKMHVSNFVSGARHVIARFPRMIDLRR